MTRALDSSVEGLVSDLGYPWYRAMLAEEGMRTVEDVLVKVGLRRRAASAAEDSGSSLSELDEPVSDADKGMFVEAYLVALGFSETHASEIAEEIVAVHDAHGSATRLRRGHSSADRMFAFDTLDDAGEDAVAEDALDEMKAFAEAFAASASPDNNALPAILQSPAPSDGPTSAEKRAVRAAAAMSKAKAAERGVTRTEPPLHRQPSDEAPLPPSPHLVRPDPGDRARSKRRRVLRPRVPPRGRAAVRPAHGRGEPRAAPVLAGAIFETREGT
jgi:hypothetical protein